MDRKYSILAFLITFAELAIVIGSYVLKSKNILYAWLVYGSPFYLVMNLLTVDSVFWEKNPIYIGLFAFHFIKYFIFFRSQIYDEPNMLRLVAVVFEAAYLGLSGYYLN